MDIERIKEIRLKQDGLSNTLGMEFLSTPDPDTCQARMKATVRCSVFSAVVPHWRWQRTLPV